MKKLAAAGLVLAFSLVAFAQATPLTQAEFVKMLYALQKAPATRSEIVAALRARGIDFVVTDGIRGLARSKSNDDEEIKRALDEADRRRQDPVASKLPSQKEADAALEATRKNTLDAVDEMPDFVVKQQIQRSAAYAGTGNFRDLDRLVVAVSYRSTGEEEYRVLSMNGIVQTNAQAKGSYEEAGGTSSTGEFVTMLATIFKPENESKFELSDTDVIRGRRALVFSFTTARDKAHQVIEATGISTDTCVTGIKGRIWIDREDARVLRIESEATEIPDSFPIRTAKRNIDYDWVKISDGKYLLPTLSDVRLTERDQSKVYETRNVIHFKDYQKYGTDVVILPDDDTPPADANKPKP